MRQTGRKRGKQEKRRERTSGGAYYTAVTPLRCSSEWEELSTHYSTDLGGQLEESSINQTDAQAEADDGRQQCPQQPPPPKHTTHLFPCTLICILPLASLIFFLFLLLFLHITLFPFLSSIFLSLVFPIIHLPPSSALCALNPPWFSSYKQ